MKKILHNKKKNSGLLFELLTQQVVESTISKNDIKAKKALYLVRKYFKPGTQLNEELQLFNAILYNEFPNWRTASRLLSEVLIASSKLDLNKLADEKFKLISEINTNFDKDSFLNAFVPSYKVLGAIYSLFESTRTPQQFDVSQKVKLEEVVISHLLDNSEIKRINKFAQSPKKDDNIDDLTFAFIMKKFNNKYGKILSESQKNFLKDYISCTSERKFNQLIEKQTKKIENSLYENMKIMKDRNLLNKLYEAMMKLSDILKFKKDKKTEMIMTYSQLIDELNKFRESK